MLAGGIPRRVALLLAVLVLLVGCKATARVEVAVEPDGSGTVTVTATFDAEAAEQLGDAASGLRLDDLRAAGWKVSGPRVVDGGGAVVSVTKGFTRPAQLGEVMSEVGGGSGVFDAWTLTASDSFTVSEYRLSGTVRLTGSLDQFSDAEVAAALDGFAVGRSPDELAAAMKDHPDALTLQVAARLPGDIESADGLETGRGGDERDVVSATYVLGDGAVVDTAVSVTSSSSDRSSVLWIIVGVGLIVASLLLAVARMAVQRRRRSRSARR